MPGAARLEVGRIGKAHGIKGEVMVHLTTDRTDPACWLLAGRRTAIDSRSKAAVKAEGQPGKEC